MKQGTSIAPSYSCGRGPAPAGMDPSRVALMVSRDDIQRLIHRQDGGRQVVSLFLDMSVDSNNKRTYAVFLAKQRGRFAELDSDRAVHHREALGEAFTRVDRWIEDNFEESNKGVAVYADIGGGWIEGFQLAVPLQNRLEIGDRPVIGPLAEIVERHPMYGVAVIDRDSLRLIGVRSGQVQVEETTSVDTLPAPNDVQAGGYSQKDYQKRKEQERRLTFKDFADRVDEFERRYHPHYFILVGIDDNVKQFTDCLSAQIRSRVVYTTPGPAEGRTSDVVQRLQPFFGQRQQEEETRKIQVLQDRVRHGHFAAAGIHETLEQLQEGKVETLVIARDLRQHGAQCRQCGFILARHDGACPYCGGEIRDGIDIGEAMIRIAQEQDVPVEFVSRQALTDVDGAAALLRF